MIVGLVHAKPLDDVATLVHSQQFNPVTRRTRPHHRRANDIERRKRVTDSRVLALECRLPALVWFPRLIDTYFAIFVYRAQSPRWASCASRSYALNCSIIRNGNTV